ncbi:hypothetical protein GCM10027266_18330 [Arenimonas alkanexedens]
MELDTKWIAITFGVLLAGPLPVSGEGVDAAPGDDPLYTTIAALDEAVFDAFNRCSDPAQLERHASYFDPDVEFYHDNGGVTWHRDEMLTNNRTHVCGNFSRELIPGSLRVHPIKDFGVIALGSHRFFQFSSGQCEGEAHFTMIWRLRGVAADARAELRPLAGCGRAVNRRRPGQASRAGLLPLVRLARSGRNRKT